MLIFVSENTDGIPGGDIGLGLRAQEGCRLAGGTLNGLEEGDTCQSREGGSWEPCAREGAPINQRLLRESRVWVMRGMSHMDRLLFIYSREAVMMGDSQSLP